VELRCERDVLVEALATAGRATASRGGSLPVLGGVRGPARRGPALPDRHGPRPRPSSTRHGQGARGRGGGAARPAHGRHRPGARAGAVHLTGHGRGGPIASGRSQFSVRLLPAGRLPPPRRRRHRGGHARRRRAWARRCGRWCGPPATTTPAHPHRGPHGRRGRRAPAGGDRQLPARAARRPRGVGAVGGPVGARALEGARRAGTAAVGRRDGHAPARPARRHLRGGGPAAHDPPHRG
jgi:hypothetical protein